MTSRWSVVLLVAAVAAAGCAAHGQTTIADHFVRQGEPSIDLGGALPASKTSAYVAQVRKLAAEARPQPRVNAPVAEMTDASLKASLDALRLAPSAEAHRLVAVQYRRLGVLDAAFRHLSVAIRLSPKDASLLDQRARIWRAWGMPRLGLPDAQRAVDLAPRSATAWNTLGLLLEGSGGREQAVRAYTRAALLDHQAGYAWDNLCRARTLQREAPAAVRACRRALDVDPSLRFAELNLYTAERMLAPPSALPPSVVEQAAMPSGAPRP